MINIGDTIPDISLKDDSGTWIRLHDYIGKKPMVIYFYPKDETPGCTAEACEFRDNYEDFESLGAVVFGISGDSVNSHQRFKRKHRLNFGLLSDEHRKAEKAFGVKRNLFGLLPGRVTFVTNIDGVIKYQFDSATQPKQHVKRTLKFLEDNL
jgi:peroxiredoxin Q/BCP